MGFFDIFRISQIKNEKLQLEQEVSQLQKKLSDLGCDEYDQVKDKIEKMEQDSNFKIEAANKTLNELNDNISNNNLIVTQQTENIADLREKAEKLQKQTDTQLRKIKRIKELYASVNYCVKNFLDTGIAELLSTSNATDLEDLTPSVTLKLHCMDVKSLRKIYKENEKNIDQILKSYASRYTTKSNRAIYQLMVIALRSELQNVLYNLKYEKLDQAINDVKNITGKYLAIAGEGNQSIAGTLTKFIGELEYLFINAVKIEYNYYVKKEQARQEQLAIKQQMREEAEERKALEQQRKKIEQEESKFYSEIEKANEALSSATDASQIAALKKRILELQGQLSDVTIKKEEISKLQNGKAGNVYIISNLGSFGEDVFKIGMTRRMNPQERIDELGSASVPFKFDVHSFIFSDDAVSLESKIHSLLNDKRVNKVNLRKEFFHIKLDELEQLVNNLDPTAEFNRTMLAEEFRQSQSSDTVYTSDYQDGFDEEDE